MLGASRRSREPSPSVAQQDWRLFCQQEGKKAAELFLNHLTTYREAHTDVVEALCIREFAISLTEALSSYGISSIAEPTPSVTSGKPPPAKGKQWWKIFKRGRTVRRKAAHSDSFLDETGVILDRVVSQMNLQEDEINGDEPSWGRCRLILINRHGNYQLEIYSPPKSAVPKMSLFCFLIEEVRSTSYLEVPDSESCFVIKSRSHGEYVFDAGCVADKDIWMNTIMQYTSNGHLPISASLGALSESQGSRSHSRGVSRFPRSRSQTPIASTVSPLVENHRPADTSDQYTSHSQPVAEEPIHVDVLSLIPSHPPSRDRRFVQSMCIDTPPHLMMPVSTSSSPPSNPNSPPSSNDEQDGPYPNQLTSPRKKSPPTDLPIRNESHSLSSSALHPVSLAAMDTMTTPSTRPPVNRQRKSSAPPTVVHELQNETSSTPPPRYNSSEALDRVGYEDRLSFITVPLSVGERGHSRQRSYDSNYSHSTDIGAPTSPLARNCYRIDIGSNERISNGTSGRSSAFSSAGNLHDVTRDQINSPVTMTTTPDPVSQTDTSSQSSNPLYIETSGPADIQLPRHTEHPYQSWANTSVDVENLRNLSQYPWFHGMISRANATSLVLLHGSMGSGQYLVRQSESREGDFVLTFNSHNRAKHLRLTLDSTGCTIQHLCFEDVCSMLEYFKTHPIPLETTPASEDITLTSFVDRSASDHIRTTTIINLERIQRTPPRRARSIHVTSSLGASLDGSSSPVHGSRSGRQGNWRQIFNRQRSSSSQSIRSHATVQRTHSANAGSLQEIPVRARGSRWGSRERNENSYVSRHY